MFATVEPGASENRVPASIQSIASRRIPRWGPTISSAAMFIFVWLVLGCPATLGFFWALVNDPTSVWLPVGGIFGLPLTLIVGIVVWRLFVRRATLKRGVLVCATISDMTHGVRWGHKTVISVSFRYSFEHDGASFSGRGLIQDREFVGLPSLPTNSDCAIVAYMPSKPARSVVWGFVYRDGRAWVPGHSTCEPGVRPT